MTQWYVKELSELTDISVQTLHHYDRIDLLKPSVRLANGYRLYSENDLSKLQQIISLKFLGFKLTQIKKLLNSDCNMIKQLSVQSELLEKQAKAMLEASKAVKNIIAKCDQNKSIAWESLLHLIKIYRRTEQLEKSWVGKFLSQEELKQYVRFEQDLNMRFTKDELDQLEQERINLISQIDANLDKDPSSDFGADIVRRGKAWSNKFYGKKYVALGLNIWKKGYKSEYIDQIDPKDSASPASVAWFDKAIESYYFNRMLATLNQIDRLPQEVIVKLWDELLTEMYGDSAFFKNELINLLLKDERFDHNAKNWLKKQTKF